MKCQKCGAEIPEGKLYCEQCGHAVQIVPDYNPAEDIAIGAEEPEAGETSAPADRTAGRKRLMRLMLAACGLLACGVVGFQGAYRSIIPAQEAEEEEEEEETMLFLASPQFSVPPGNYDYAPRLTLSHEERDEGTIYYTTDGTTPDTGSQIYSRPIELGEGKTVLRAIFIRNDGVQSEEADGIYTVTFHYPDEPTFSMPAGTYTEGFYVEMTVGDGSSIHYTTNGAEPDGNSALYREPVYIGPGLTVLQAIAVDEDGGESGIVEAIYDVEGTAAVPEEEILPQDVPLSW